MRVFPLLPFIQDLREMNQSMELVLLKMLSKFCLDKT